MHGVALAWFAVDLLCDLSFATSAAVGRYGGNGT